MKASQSPFIQPRFTGGRFHSPALPVDAASDLYAYEELIIDVAKQLYRRDHPEKKVLPKGFGKDFQLRIVRIDPGSSRPFLSAAVAGMLALGDGLHSYFERARDLVSECVDFSNSEVPADFPMELLVSFKNLGKSLRDGESMELPMDGAKVAVLNLDKRRRLIDAGSLKTKKHVEIMGVMTAFNATDPNHPSVEIRIINGTGHVAAHLSAADGEKLKECWLRPRHAVQIGGSAEFNAAGKLLKIASVEEIYVIKDYKIRNKLESLKDLSDGWYYGDGSHLDSLKLDSIINILVGGYPYDLPYPSIFPTPEGNLSLEWGGKCSASVDIFLSDLSGEFHAFRGDREVEFKCDLSTAPAWDEFYPRIESFIR